MNPNSMYPKYWNKIEYRTCVLSEISHIRSLSVGLKAISNHGLGIGRWSTIPIPRDEKNYVILALTM
jgi:hypothetical protein